MLLCVYLLLLLLVGTGTGCSGFFSSTSSTSATATGSAMCHWHWQSRSRSESRTHGGSDSELLTTGTLALSRAWLIVMLPSLHCQWQLPLALAVWHRHGVPVLTRPEPEDSEAPNLKGIPRLKLTGRLHWYYASVPLAVPVTARRSRCHWQ